MNTLRTRVQLVAIALALLVATTGTSLVAAQQTDEAPRSVVELIRVADDVYSFRYAGHITMFIVTDEGVITADPLGMQNPLAPALLKMAIRSVTDQPVRYVVITHWGADHGMGGDVFADTARFISHPITAQRIAEANDPSTPVPDTLVSDSLALELGSKRVDVYYTGRNQSDDYLMLHYPARQPAFIVDFVRPRAVAFRDFPSGNIEEWVQSLTRIEDLQFDMLLLGHPPTVASKDAVREMRQYLQDLMSAIRAARAAGIEDGSEAMTTAVRGELAPKYGSWANFDNFIPLNIAGAIRTMAS